MQGNESAFLTSVSCPSILLRMATVSMTMEAYRHVDELPIVIRRRIDKLVLRLEQWPHVSGAKPLSGDLAGCWRLRTGDYRLQFRVVGDDVIVEKVGHRDGFYDK